MHQNPATGVKPRRTFFPIEKGDLAQYPDRRRVLVTIGELRRVMKDQNRGTAPRNEPLACRCKVTRQDIGFADSVVPENRYAALVLAESWQAHGVAPPTLLDSCSSSCRSRLPWRTSGNSHPTTSFSIHASVSAASTAVLRSMLRDICLVFRALTAP
jgi:hypothetical protein